ncbi:MAG: hypothetical protein HYS18_02095 [Burkholderiales bacterium]|nr:hypothetical protein [Burkholderiales bacterium]
MLSWIEQMIGLTPKAKEKAKQMEQKANELALVLPYVVNRQVLALIPKKKCFDWTNQWNERSKVERPLDVGRDQWSYTRFYLVHGQLKSEDLPALIAKHRKYFLKSYVDGYAPKSLWPWAPTEDEFSEWYDAVLIPGNVHDLDESLLAKEPDILKAITHQF